MKGKVSTPIEWMVSTPTERERETGVDTGGDRHTYILTDRLSDQPTRVLEFHMLYGTKNREIYKISLPNINTELSRVAAEIPCLPNGRDAAKDQVDVDSK